MSDFIDFDAAWAEEAAARAAGGNPDPEPKRVKVRGQVWELPGRVPAGLIIYGTRLTQGGDRALTDAEIAALAGMIVPEPVIDAWVALGLSMDELGLIVRRLIDAYMHPAGSPPEASAPQAAGNGSSRRSSAAGRSSKRTSPGSTAPTSTG